MKIKSIISCFCFFLVINLAGAAALPDFFAAMPKKDIHGKTIKYNKKVYLFDIWSITCPPCRLTVPELAALQKDNTTKNFTVLGLALDSNAKVINDFLKKLNATYPVAIATETALAKFPPVRGIPTLFLVDSSGKILKTYIGYTDKPTFQKDLDEYLIK